MTTTLHDAANTASTPRVLRRYRVAISTMFAIAGVIIGAWTARIPAIQHHLDLTDSHLSIVLLALACGGLVGMRCAGRLVDRHGSTRVMTVTSLTLGAALTVTAYAPNMATLALALLALGTVHGTLNVAMNAAAVACQTAYRRPIMTSFHAQFSIGGVAGAAAAAGCAHVHLSVGHTFAGVGAALTVAAFWAIRRLNLAPNTEAVGERPASTPERGRGPGRRRVALLGLLAFCALISEGAAADWSSVYLDRLGASPAYAAAAYAAFAGCMTLGRLTGDRLTAGVAPVTLLRGCGLIAGGGLAAGVLIGSPAAAIIGFGCLGAGLSCVIPLLYSTAGNLDPDRPGAALSRVSAVGYLGYVTGPVIIGGAATHVGLGHALLILPVLAALLVAAAPVVRPAAARPTPLPSATSS
ncbi:MFS transporter [Actinoplanes sp. ATCC 53533]|uniref:MFS transporter n=1 Tax=Actinoplanes sp. ATCC 53533 TaxID=1288362 RepID=UPI000F79B77E|nr:MFS transporter [Actinoplanes sp. ATCC 53533]RSM67444.1 MFS transporter [Actinoplanes sp. ATCC 53533]